MPINLASSVAGKVVSRRELRTGAYWADHSVKAVRFSTLEKLCRELNCQPGDLLEYKPE